MTRFRHNSVQLHIISFDMGNDICLNVHVGTYQYIPFRLNDHRVSLCLTNIFEDTELNNRISVNTHICSYLWILFTLVRIVISLSLHIFILVNSRTVYLSHERYHKTVTCNRLYNTITIVSNHLRLPFNIMLLNIYYVVLELYNRKYFKLIICIDMDCLLYVYYKKLTYWDNSDHEIDCKHNFKEENIITSSKIHIPTSIVSTLNHNYYEICPHCMYIVLLLLRKVSSSSSRNLTSSNYVIFINSLICLYISSYNITLMHTIIYFNHGIIAFIIHVFHNVQSKCGSDILIHLSYMVKCHESENQGPQRVVKINFLKVVGFDTLGQGFKRYSVFSWL